ncbi:MEDS domain-containing protein [Variovorax sp. OV329]|uniref:MEDS domain-containing protein n=1 Tax=Variovorax sp. OV329 TaxID=1882825 RepID=UPI000B818FCA
MTTAFIKDGLEHSQPTCQIVDPSLRDEHLRQLYAAGIDVAQQQREGRLEVHSVFDMYLRDGHFDVPRMLSVIQQHISTDSHPISRITGHAEWAWRRLAWRVRLPRVRVPPQRCGPRRPRYRGVRV